MTAPRDWDKEMAAIDKVIASGKAPPPSGAPGPAPRDGQAKLLVAPGAGAVITRRRDTVGVWFRTLLGAAGAAALPFWPYGKTCGTLLYLYLLGAVGVTAAGIWAMRGAWTHRRGIAHTAGMLVMLAGLTLVALEVLHRTGFAAVRLSWICP